MLEEEIAGAVMVEEQVHSARGWCCMQELMREGICRWTGVSSEVEVLAEEHLVRGSSQWLLVHKRRKGAAVKAFA